MAKKRISVRDASEVQVAARQARKVAKDVAEAAIAANAGGKLAAIEAWQENIAARLADIEERLAKLGL